MLAWKATLPHQFRLEPEIIWARQSQNQLSALVQLHLWYDTCLSELYRAAHPGFPESIDPQLLEAAPMGWAAETRARCVQHAKLVASTLKTLSEYVDRRTFVYMDASLPICVYENIRVLVQGLFMVPADMFPAARGEMIAEAELMLGFVADMRRHFKQAAWLVSAPVVDSSSFADAISSTKRLAACSRAMASPSEIRSKRRIRRAPEPHSTRGIRASAACAHGRQAPRHKEPPCQ